MTEHHEEIGDPRQEPLGSIFERTRRSQHKTLDEAAVATSISPRVLASLEADDFDRLPAEVFTRGFIKLYAKYLGLDPNVTLNHYINQENADPDKPADRPYRSEILKGEAMAHAPAYFKGNRRALTVILLLAVLVGFYALGRIYKPIGNQVGEVNPDSEVTRTLAGNPAPTGPEIMPAESEAKPSPEATPVDEGVKVMEPRVLARKNPATAAEPEGSPANPEPELMPEPKPEPAPVKPQSPASVKPAPVAASSATTIPDIKMPMPAPVPSTISSDVPPAVSSSPQSRSFLPVTVNVATTSVDGAKDETAASSTTTPVPPNYVLEAKFREGSWVHVEVDDEPVREYTSQADVTRVWRATNRLVLELGNAGAVDLTLNGKPLPLTIEPGNTAIIRIPPDLP